MFALYRYEPAMDMSLAKTAARLGMSRPQLINRMRSANLLTTSNLPAFPTRDKAYLRTKESHWYHPELGLQYSQSTRVTPAGILWLTKQLGLAPPPTDPDRRYVA